MHQEIGHGSEMANKREIRNAWAYPEPQVTRRNSLEQQWELRGRKMPLQDGVRVGQNAPDNRGLHNRARCRVKEDLQLRFLVKLKEPRHPNSRPMERCGTGEIVGTGEIASSQGLQQEL